jgi:tyrosine-protein kinase Etk/Wzc
MKNESSLNPESELELSSVDIKKIVRFFFKKLHWFAICIAISLTYAYFKVDRIIPIYNAKASLLIKGQSNAGFFAEGSAFQDIDYYNSYFNPLDNEIAILKSRKLIHQVVTDLKLNIQFFLKKENKTVELYNNPPLKLTFIDGDSLIKYKFASFTISILSEKEYQIIENNDDKDGELETKNFGSTIKTSIGDLIITPLNIEVGNTYILSFSSVEAKISEFFNSINVEKINDYTNVILLSYQDPNEFKAKEIVNNFIFQHQKDAIEDKNQVAKNSVAFINERIQYITKELNEVESDFQNYQSGNMVFDVASEKGIFLNSLNSVEKDYLENEVQMTLIGYIKNYLYNQEDLSMLIPANIGLNDNTTQGNVDLYNNLVLERNRLLKSSSEKNPIALNLENKLNSLRKNLLESLQKSELIYKLKQEQLQDQNKEISSRIKNLPKKEKEIA